MVKTASIVTGFVIGGLCILLTAYNYHSSITRTHYATKRSYDDEHPVNNHASIAENITRILIKQRNNLSKHLNLKQQKIGQLECEKIVYQKIATSASGGWCQKTSKEDSGHHMTDHHLANALIEFFEGKYVGSFGDGPGRYKQLLLDSKKVKGYDAYDGAPYCDITSEGRVVFLDLTLPQYGLPMYEWVLSLEVAEHIPKVYEHLFIDNIVRHAKEGVVLSWARLGQGGYSHVNNQPFEYVSELMERLGFSHDEVNSTKLKTLASFDWFKANTNVYRRKDMSVISAMQLNA